MKKKVMLVTGASSGIGKACAEYFSVNNWCVYGGSRSIRSNGYYKFHPVNIDVNKDQSVKEGIKYILGNEGRIDAVINCAGTGLIGAFEETTVEEAKDQFETNFFGVQRICREVIPVMRNQSSGHLIVISSLSGLSAYPFLSFYSASKFALEGLSEAMRMELKPFGIRVVLIEPGTFHTNLSANSVRTKESINSPTYGKRLENAFEMTVRAEYKAPDIILIPRLIDRILKKSNTPRLRYKTGLFSEKFGVAIKNFIPYRLYEYMIMKVAGI
jgi:NAD(P)-dependent dehydrogenase (short-subunit alcohol dehydrogenase family)